MGKINGHNLYFFFVILDTIMWLSSFERNSFFCKIDTKIEFAAIIDLIVLLKIGWILVEPNGLVRLLFDNANILLY